MTYLAGHYYHVYNRGCNREPIFLCEDNYFFLLKRMKHLLPTSQVSIIAYNLMPNHYHFVLRSETDDGISRFIMPLFDSYTQAFNKQQGRTGTLFQGRAKHIEVDSDIYVIHLTRYIHLNPVMAHLVSSPEEWPYSNYLEWIDRRPGTLIDREFVRRYFPNPGDYQLFVNSTIDDLMLAKLKRYFLE